MSVSVSVPVYARQRGWERKGAFRKSRQNKPPVPSSLGRASLQPGPAVLAGLGSPVFQSWQEPKGCGAVALRGSVAEHGARQLVGQRVPALDFLVLVFQAVEPVLEPLPFGINS